MVDTKYSPVHLTISFDPRNRTNLISDVLKVIELVQFVTRAIKISK